METTIIADGVFTLAALFFIFAGATLYRAVDSYRWGERRNAVVAFAVFWPMIVLGAGAIWVGLHHPVMSSNKNAFPDPDWVCLTFGSAGSSVCYRDVLSGSNIQGNERAQTR